MGDTVLVTAPLLALRENFPKAEIHVAVPSIWSSILEHHPAVDKLWHYELRKEKTVRAKAIARLALKVRKEKYDWVINFHASPSSSMLSFASGAPVRANHFHGHKDKNRYSTVEIPGKKTVKPIIERDMDALRALELPIEEGRLPQVFLSDSEIQRGKEYLEHFRSHEPVLGIGLGASRPTKIWPVDRYAALAVSWCLQTQGSALAIAGPGEEYLVQEFMSAVDDQLKIRSKEGEHVESIHQRIGNVTHLPIRQLASILKQCSVYVGNDSGPKHLAIAVKTPTVTLIGPEHPYEWHPYPTDLHPYLFVEDLACRRDAIEGMPPWCGLHTCTTEHHKCMHLIRVEQVLEECKRVGETQKPRMM